MTFHHLHTGESLRTTYFADGLRTSRELAPRDWRAQRARAVDPELLDTLWGSRQRLESSSPIQVICGYWTPQTNAMLRRRSEWPGTAFI